jgi:hypothetical protein
MMCEADVFIPWQDAFYILKKALAMPQPAYILRLLVSVWADYDDGIGSQEMNELMAAPAITAYMRRTDVPHKERTAFVEHVARTIVVEYADRLIECWRSRHPLAKTTAVREAFAALRVEAAATIQSFMIQALFRHRRFLKRMGTLLAIPVRRRLLVRFCSLAVAKWRSLQQQECYVCMTVGGTDECGMIPLHMDMRHAICRKCRDAVVDTTGECPMCRKSLCVVEDSSSYADTDDLTSVSYSGSEGVEGSEDPADYDDLDYLD